LVSGEVDRRGDELDGNAGALDFVGGWLAGADGAGLADFIGDHEAHVH
jgi:hypothetical protein